MNFSAVFRSLWLALRPVALVAFVVLLRELANKLEQQSRESSYRQPVDNIITDDLQGL